MYRGEDNTGYLKYMVLLDVPFQKVCLWLERSLYIIAPYHHLPAMASKHTSQHSTPDDLYVKNMIELVAYCYQLHKGLSFQIHCSSQAEQKVAYDAACIEWQQPDKPNDVLMDQGLQELFFPRIPISFNSSPPYADHPMTE